MNTPQGWRGSILLIEPKEKIALAEKKGEMR